MNDENFAGTPPAPMHENLIDAPPPTADNGQPNLFEEPNSFGDDAAYQVLDGDTYGNIAAPDIQPDILEPGDQLMEDNLNLIQGGVPDVTDASPDETYALDEIGEETMETLIKFETELGIRNAADNQFPIAEMDPVVERFERETPEPEIPQQEIVSSSNDVEQVKPDNEDDLGGFEHVEAYQGYSNAGFVADDDVSPPAAHGILPSIPSQVPTSAPADVLSDIQAGLGGSISKDQTPKGWFSVHAIDPRVLDLVYWRDVKKSAVVFCGGLLVLLCLNYWSIVALAAYISLTILTITLTYRLYKSFLQTLYKSDLDTHPFTALLEADMRVPPERAHQLTDVLLSRFNAVIDELRKLFLVQHYSDSLKFGVLMWMMTHIAYWFDVYSLALLLFVTAFTWPKIYETNQEKIDEYAAIVHEHINTAIAKVQEKVGKKAKQL